MEPALASLSEAGCPRPARAPGAARPGRAPGTAGAGRRRRCRRSRTRRLPVGAVGAHQELVAAAEERRGDAPVRDRRLVEVAEHRLVRGGLHRPGMIGRAVGLRLLGMATGTSGAADEGRRWVEAAGRRAGWSACWQPSQCEGDQCEPRVTRWAGGPRPAWNLAGSPTAPPDAAPGGSVRPRCQHALGIDFFVAAQEFARRGESPFGPRRPHAIMGP